MTSPRDTWEAIPEKDPNFIPQIEPYAPLQDSPCGVHRSTADGQTSTPFTVLSAAELMAKQLPPKKNLLGEGIIVMGQLTSILGQGGTGKSRFTMQLAISQVVGRNFAGFKTHPQPLKHLLIGTENSIHRQQSELRKMTCQLSPDDAGLLGQQLYFHVVESMDDAFINIGSPEIAAKWNATLEAIRPDVIYVDPFGEIVVGDVNKDADVRHTLRELTKICRRHNHDTAIIVVHHARTGRGNIAQAVGYDKGNYGLGSKALYSGVRSQLNLAPADPEDTSRIVLSCGKSNDAKPFDPVGLKLDDRTMCYNVDDTFDLNTWKDDIEGKQSGQSATIKDVIQAIQGGSTTHNAICNVIVDGTGCSQRTAKRRLGDALAKDYVRKSSEGRYLVTQKALSA